MFQAQGIFQPWGLWPCLLPPDFGFSLDSAIEGQTLSSLTVSGAAPPAGRAGKGASAQRSAGGARESGGAHRAADLLCVWEWQVRLRPGTAALRAAVSEGLAPGGQRAAFQPLLGPTSCLGEKTERPPAGNSPLPTASPQPSGPGLWGKPYGGWLPMAGTSLLLPLPSEPLRQLPSAGTCPSGSLHTA